MSEMKHSAEQSALVSALGLSFEDLERVKQDLDSEATFEALVLAAKFLDLHTSMRQFAEDQEADGFSLSAEEHHQRASRYEACYWSICRQWPTPTTEAVFEDEDHAQRIGLEWKDNSSLEKWFPFTAKELESLRAELAKNKAAIESYADRLKADSENQDFNIQHRVWMAKIQSELRVLLQSEEKESVKCPRCGRDAEKYHNSVQCHKCQMRPLSGPLTYPK